jgi:hypothetical protein
MYKLLYTLQFGTHSNKNDHKNLRDVDHTIFHLFYNTNREQFFIFETRKSTAIKQDSLHPKTPKERNQLHHTTQSKES